MTTRRVVLAYAVLGVGLWPVPLFNILHVEAAAVVAFAAFFVAGWAALDAFRGRHPLGFGHVLLTQTVALLVPLGLLTASLLWTPNCDYLRGLLFYGLFPGITVVLAVSLAYALSGTGWRRPKGILGAVGLGVALAGLIYDLGWHPQFYTYNHVFGGVLGPIYDEELAVRTGLFTFRGLTLLWALFLFLAGRWLRMRRRPAGRRGAARTEDRGARIENIRTGPTTYRYGAGMLGMLVLIGLCYVFSARLGFNTPAWYLQERLGGHHRTEHFDLYYDPASLDEHELAAIAEDHEYRYAWLEDRLEMEGPARIASYLYPDPATKARLTGARATSVAPVWLPQPQTHVRLDRYEATFGHELAHVFSRAFGLPVMKASWAVGLVEGLAVALEPPDGRPTPHEQVSAAMLSGATDADVLAERMAARLHPLGFWTGRGAVSYTTMGSFVQFLLDRYGPERVRTVYARANFEAVYGRSLEALTREWTAYLQQAPPIVARDAEALVTRRFAQPSLFERRCPHYVPPYRRAYREGRRALAAGDTARALDRFEATLHAQPRFVTGHRALARLRLARGAADAVVQQLDTLAIVQRSPTLAVLLADAYALQGTPGAARDRYEAAFEGLPLYAHESRALVSLRRATAEHPALVEILVAGDSAHVQARRLDARAERSPAGRAWAALQYMQAGAYAPAADIWAALPPDVAPELPAEYREVLRRQVRVWRARCALRRGHYAEAQHHARAAAEAFRSVGALNLAAAVEDLAQQARWAARQDGGAVQVGEQAEDRRGDY